MQLIQQVLIGSQLVMEILQVAVDAIQFKMDSGNIDAGTITLYGIN